MAAKDEEFPQLVETIEDMLERGLDIYVNVNNHYEGSAPLTIEKLERIAGTRGPRDPTRSPEAP